MRFDQWYDKNYKKLLVIPTVLIFISLIYLVYFSAINNSIIYRDVSLTGGATYTIATDFPAKSLEEELSTEFSDFEVRSVKDNTGAQIELIVTVPESKAEEMKAAIEDILDIKLTSDNSSEEFTSSSLSEDFFRQLIIAVILAFFWMAAVVFIIFSRGWKTKTQIIIGNLLFAAFLGYFFFSLNIILSVIIFFFFASFFMRTYIKNSVPAFAVMLSAFADIVMTLALVNLIGMRLSSAGIVAFLMLIGYSVDTDIMLTTRILRKKESVNRILLGAFKTGITMMATSMIALATALFVVYPFSSVLDQIFTILLIGLGFDILNTWITNASIIKWYAEEKLQNG